MKKLEYQSHTPIFNISYRINNPQSYANQSLDIFLDITRKVKDLRVRLLAHLFQTHLSNTALICLSSPFFSFSAPIHLQQCYIERKHTARHHQTFDRYVLLHAQSPNRSVAEKLLRLRTGAYEHTAEVSAATG